MEASSNSGAAADLQPTDSLAKKLHVRVFADGIFESSWNGDASHFVVPPGFEVRDALDVDFAVGPTDRQYPFAAVSSGRAIDGEDFRSGFANRRKAQINPAKTGVSSTL